MYTEEVDYSDESESDHPDDADAVDLYGDLCEEQAVINAEINCDKSPSGIAQQVHREALKVEKSEAQSKLAALEEENKTLIRNISCLFKTAQAEIYRKDREVRLLREQLSQVKLERDGQGPAHKQAATAQVQ